MKIFWFLVSVTMPLFAFITLTQTPSAIAQVRTPPLNPLVSLRDFLAICENENDVPAATAACGGYIAGFIAGSLATRTALAARVIADEVMDGTIRPTEDAIEAAGARLEDRWSLFCIRSSFTSEEIRRRVVQYGREHPNLAPEESTVDHMLSILEAAFPCKE